MDAKLRRVVVHDGTGHSFWLAPNNEPEKLPAARIDWALEATELSLKAKYARTVQERWNRLSGQVCSRAGPRVRLLGSARHCGSEYRADGPAALMLPRRWSMGLRGLDHGAEKLLAFFTRSANSWR
jgi:hypothetical protein